VEQVRPECKHILAFECFGRLHLPDLCREQSAVAVPTRIGVAIVEDAARNHVPGSVVIDLPDPLMAIGVERAPVEQLAAGIAALRHLRENIRGNRQDPVRRNHIFGELPAGEQIDHGGPGAGEVAAALRIGHESNVRKAGASTWRTLIASEKKDLVVNNRSTDGSAELVSLQSAATSRKEITGIQRIVAQELKR